MDINPSPPLTAKSYYASKDMYTPTLIIATPISAENKVMESVLYFFFLNLALCFCYSKIHRRLCIGSTVYLGNFCLLLLQLLSVILFCFPFSHESCKGYFCEFIQNVLGWGKTFSTLKIQFLITQLRPKVIVYEFSVA